jgi:predicted nucleotidyltransferase
MTLTYFSRDIQDLLSLLFKHKVRYLIVGAEAVIYYGFARLTGDVDIFFEPSPKNCRTMFSALREFWAGPVPGIGSPAELATKGTIIQFGYPPNRIDLINTISGVDFPEAWKGRSSRTLLVRKRSVAVHYIGLSALIKNKEACGRPKDLEDLKYLREAVKKAGHKT